MNILPTFASMMDYSSMKHSIIPRITALCASSRETSVSCASNNDARISLCKKVAYTITVKSG